MSEHVDRVELTASFLERLDAIETFLTEADAAFAFHDLLAELRAAVIQNLARFPRDAERLLFATEGRDHKTMLDFVVDLQARGGDPAAVRHVGRDMRAACAKGVGMALPDAAIGFDRFHFVALTIDAMDQVRCAEMHDTRGAVNTSLGSTARQTPKGRMWGMRKNPLGWNTGQLHAMHWLQHSTLRIAQSWQLKMRLREVYAQARLHSSTGQAALDLKRWLSWEERC